MRFVQAAACVVVIGVSIVRAGTSDPCAAIAGQTWVSPEEVRACFIAAKVDPEVKANIVEVVNKTLAFHTSVNYQRQAPPPFEDIHEDIVGDLARISGQSYASDFDLHLDMSRSLKRLNDGHCVYINFCYDALYSTVLPTPLVLLTDAEGTQNIHIAPEAYTVASVEFEDEIDFWEESLPSDVSLSSLSGARVYLINGADPWAAVNANTFVTGGYQGYGTRQNSFFSSYGRAESGWSYVMGNFALQTLPLVDSVMLTIQRVNHSEIETVVLPYRSRLSPAASPWTDFASFRANNCVADDLTNGIDIYAQEARPTERLHYVDPTQKPFTRHHRSRKHHLNMLLDATPAKDVKLPPALTPANPLNGSWGVVEFHMLDDAETGVLVLGSFSASSYANLQESLLVGLVQLKEKGATKLIVDVTNNGGGFICIAHWLHRLIAGPSPTTIPQAGLQTETRAGPLAQLIVKQIAQGADPDALLLYNPLGWEDANNVPLPGEQDWLSPPVNVTINGVKDAFSQRLGDECQPFEMQPPLEALFDPKKVAIVSNGRCASSCSLFSITMAKEEGTKTVVVGGKVDVPQQYCGIVGGQSTQFTTIDTEIKTAGLKNHSLAPPDFKTNSLQGVTWRLGFGIDDPSEPEEWQDHPADVNLPLTVDMVNNPIAIWEKVAKKVL